MVQADIAQLSTECSEWRQNLRNYRDELHGFQKQLQQIAANASSKDQLKEIEHYENQFHIQLINIHDLKLAMKHHERKVQHESEQGNISEHTLQRHEDLYNRYTTLENTLHDLRNDFGQFIS